jgi:hypothetical protein
MTFVLGIDLIPFCLGIIVMPFVVMILFKLHWFK